MVMLSVNVNKVALLRNSRDTGSPDVVAFARLCVESGADGITVHPRPDQRHIRADDVYQLAPTLDVEFNIEGNPFAPAQPSNRTGVSDYPGFMQLVKDTKPAQATLVPDGDDQLTSDHGFDLSRDGERLKPIIEELKAIGCRISLFMDPDHAQIEHAKQLGVDRIELYTGPYAAAMQQGGTQADTVFEQYYQAAKFAQDIGIGLNAGHDLDLHNLTRFATVPGLLEVSIGHELTVDALRMGIPEAIKRYQACLQPR